MDADCWTRVPPGTDLPHVVNCLVEIPKGRRNKFEIDKATGLFKLDRYLYWSSHYPGDNGFVPQTLAEDGDALDALIIINEATFTGCVIEARILGLFRMSDRGAHDYKLLAVPHSDPLFRDTHALSDVPNAYLHEVEHFFRIYKQLENVTVETLGWAGVSDALEEVRHSVERYRHARANLR